ncbi:hypothetical protein H5410_031300 [Solanum commersonii]|uniref:Uncharacterized protein n=1 Tax=Solanum commersonii TaxID=4109 RepID=A0A9J5YHZ1_SOLCO|nr:hypothetical protein H5410_031300 [Solanum commersonii]
MMQSTSAPGNLMSMVDNEHIILEWRWGNSHYYPRNYFECRDDLLKKCLVGLVGKDTEEKPTLADMRRWTAANWKSTFGLSIYV